MKRRNFISMICNNDSLVSLSLKAHNSLRLPSCVKPHRLKTAKEECLVTVKAGSSDIQVKRYCDLLSGVMDCRKRRLATRHPSMAVRVTNLPIAALRCWYINSNLKGSRERISQRSS